jgi:hypothetical protein
MSLVTQSLLHPFMVFTKLHQSPTMNQTQVHQNHSKQKTQIPSQQTLHSHNNSVTSEGVLSKVTLPPYILYKRKLLKELPIT